MGVNALWTFLRDRGLVAHIAGVDLVSEIEGKTVAIDASPWIVQSMTQGAVDHQKFYLKVVFDRLCHYLRTGALPVLVFDGNPPPAKQEALQRRLEARGGYGGGYGGYTRNCKGTGSDWFQSMAKDVQDLLAALKLPYVTASGEAEATCAVLNARGLVDGVVTEDGDALLYGAHRVYKSCRLNTNLRPDDHKAEVVDGAEVAVALGIIDAAGSEADELDARMALALLSGSDFMDGVRGLGLAKALKVVRALQKKQRQQRQVAAAAAATTRGGGSSSLLDLLRQELDKEVDASIADSRGSCSTCATCRHGRVGKKAHGKQGCDECGTQPAKAGGNGEGGCLPRPLGPDEGCPCTPCRQRDDRLLHKMARQAAEEMGERGGKQAFLAMFDRARQAYRAVVAGAEADVEALGKGYEFKWRGRPQYEELQVVMARYHGYKAEAGARVAGQILPLLVEWDARYAGKELGMDMTGELRAADLDFALKECGFFFVPSGIERVSEIGGAPWRYQMRFEVLGPEARRIVQEVLEGKRAAPQQQEGEDKGDEDEAEEKAAGGKDAARHRAAAALEKLAAQLADEEVSIDLKAVLGQEKVCLRMSLVRAVYPRMVEAFEKKERERRLQARPTKPQKAKALTDAADRKGQTKLDRFFAASAKGGGAGGGGAAALPSASSSSSSSSLVAPARAAPARAEAEEEEQEIAFLDLTDGSPGAAATATVAAAARPPRSPSRQELAPATPIKPPERERRSPPRAPVKGKRPGGSYIADVELEDEEGLDAEYEGVFGSRGPRRDLGSPLKKARGWRGDDEGEEAAAGAAAASPARMMADVIDLTGAIALSPAATSSPGAAAAAPGAAAGGNRRARQPAEVVDLVTP